MTSVNDLTQFSYQPRDSEVKIEIIEDFGVPVRIRCDQDGKWFNLNEVVGGTCFDAYDPLNDGDAKKQLVARVVNNLPNINKVKKQFPGNNASVWAVSLPDVLKVTHYLANHSDRFKRHSDFINRTFMRVLAGDQTLHGDIDANARSNHVVNQAAREALAAEAGGPVVGPGNVVAGVVGDSDDQIHPIVKRTKTLRGVSDNHRAMFDSRIGAARELVGFMADLGAIDDTTRTSLKHHALRIHGQYNGSFENASALILNGAVDDMEVDEITSKSSVLDIASVVRRLGFSATDKDLRSLGVKFSNAYFDRYKQVPTKTTDRLPDGSVITVNEYTSEHLGWIEPIIRAHFGALPANQRTLDSMMRV